MKMVDIILMGCVMSIMIGGMPVLGLEFESGGTHYNVALDGLEIAAVFDPYVTQTLDGEPYEVNTLMLNNNVAIITMTYNNSEFLKPVHQDITLLYDDEEFGNEFLEIGAIKETIEVGHRKVAGKNAIIGSAYIPEYGLKGYQCAFMPHDNTITWIVIFSDKYYNNMLDVMDHITAH